MRNKNKFKVISIVLAVSVFLGSSVNQAKATTGSLTTGLVAYWSLDEASGSRASSVGSHTAVQTGTVASAAGKVSNAAVFDSTNDLEVIGDSALNTQGTAFSVSLWVKLNSKVSTQDLVSKITEYRVRYDSGADRFAFQVINGGSTPAVYADNLGSPSTGTWYHIVATRNAAFDTQSIYVNAGTPNTAVSDNSGTMGTIFAIGAYGGLTFPSDSTIDEVGFWTRSLNSGEISALYNSGNARAYSTFAGFDPNPIFGGGQQYTNISNVKIDVSGATSAKVSWDTDRSSNGVVEYSSDNTLSSSVSDLSYGMSHSVNLSGLKPDTAYILRIKANTATNTITTSFTYNFKTELEPVVSPAPAPVIDLVPVPSPEPQLLPQPLPTPEIPQVIFPENAMDGEVLIFKDNPTIFLVKLDGLYPFSTWKSYMNYLSLSKQKLKKLTGPSSLYTLKNTLASDVLNIAE